MNTATLNTKDAARNNPAEEVPASTLPSLFTDAMRFLAFAAGLTGAAVFLRGELAPLGASVASGLLNPHTLGQALGMF